MDGGRGGVGGESFGSRSIVSQNWTNMQIIPCVQSLLLLGLVILGKMSDENYTQSFLEKMQQSHNAITMMINTIQLLRHINTTRYSQTIKNNNSFSFNIYLCSFEIKHWTIAVIIFYSALQSQWTRAYQSIKSRTWLLDERKKRTQRDQVKLTVKHCNLLFTPQETQGNTWPVFVAPAPHTFLRIRNKKKQSSQRVIILIGYDCPTFRSGFPPLRHTAVTE